MHSPIIILASAAAEVSGNPVSQLAGQFGVQWHLLIAQMINFCVVAFLLYRFAFKPILATVAERQKSIADGLQYTEEMKRKLEDAERDYASSMKQAALEAKQIIEESRDKAKSFYEKQHQEALEKAAEVLQKAEQAIALEKQQMLRDLRKEVAQLVVETTSRVLEKKLSSAEQTLFSDVATKELAARN